MPLSQYFVNVFWIAVARWVERPGNEERLAALSVGLIEDAVASREAQVAAQALADAGTSVG